MAQDLLADAAKAKEEGLIRHISFSFHDEPLAIKYIIDESKKTRYSDGEYACSVQFCLTEQMRKCFIMQHLMELEQLQWVLQAADDWQHRQSFMQSLLERNTIATYELAFKFVLGNPDLNCALSGMQTLDMVKQNAKLASDSTGFSKEEWQQLGEAMEQLKKFSELYCTGCKYCQPCPAGIEINNCARMSLMLRRAPQEAWLSEDGRRR